MLWSKDSAFGLLNNVFNALYCHPLNKVNVALAVAPPAAIGVFGIHIEELEATFGVGFLVAFTSALGGIAMAGVMHAKLRHRETLQAQLAAALGATGFTNPLLVALAAAFALGGDASEGEANKFSARHGVDDVEDVRAANGNNLLFHGLAP